MRRLFVLVTVLALLVTTSVTMAQGGQVVHIVAPGENLYRISVRYNVAIASIAAANGIYNVNHIYAGQRLVIPTGGVIPGPVPQPGGNYYTVQWGDTLGRIAARFNTNFWATAAANNLYNPNFVYVGQVLYIPPHIPTQIATYYVVRGDTLGVIAARYGTTVWAIASYNGLVNPSLIYPGQRLYIPY